MSFGNHVAYMNLYIFKGNKFYETGKLSIKVYQKPENRYMYIPFKSAHPRYTIKNYVLEVKTIRQDKYSRTQFPQNQKHFFPRILITGL